MAATVPAQNPQSGWRIRYEVLAAGTHNYGGSAVLEFQSIEFMRGHDESGAEDWIKILNNLVLAEMYVPYNDGTEIFDISGFSFDFVSARPEYIGQGSLNGQILEDGIVVAEVVDEHVRWMDSFDNAARRGQALELWATLDAANYRYVLKYSFTDDGTIRVRVGGTAQNLRSVPIGSQEAIHIHSPAWRMEFDLGAADRNEVHVVERIHQMNSAEAELVHRPFNGGTEGGEVWNPERFTSLMITSGSTRNRHDPASPISYKVMSMRSGSTRTYRAHTQYDFWTVRRFPSAAARNPELERRFVDVADYVRNPEPLAGAAAVLWHTTALHHRRTEDFGQQGFNAREGLALNMWTGFDLMPHDLWEKTPLFARQ